MLVGFARGFKSLPLSRAGCHAGLASILLLAGAGSVHDATALGETRTLSFHHTHSDEDLTVTFKRNGRYDEEALKKINHFLRDWRSQDQTTMDRHLFDILWEVYRDVDGKQPIQIISAYRAPATNAMLRRRSSGVARFSQHMNGQAMDFFIPGVALEQIRFAGLRLQRGGVGFYPTSGSPFVHLDTGSIRHWPRMNHDQLARVFPDGRTVHIPSDGNPLRGYELAKADIEKRGDGDSDSYSRSKPSLLASLFSRGKPAADEDDEGGATAAAPAKPSAASLMAAAVPAKSADPVPVPRAKPAAAGTFQLASADAQIVRASKPAAPRQPRRTRRSRKRRLTSSMRAASGAMLPRRRSRRRPSRSPRSRPARPLAEPTRNRPPASPPRSRRWPMRRRQRLRLNVPTSWPPVRRCRGSSARPRPRATRWP